MLAPVLDLDEGARVPRGEAPEGDGGRSLPGREHVPYPDEGAGALGEAPEKLGEDVSVPGPEDDVDTGNRRHLVRARLGVAARHHHERVGAPGDRPPDRLPP